MCVEVGSRSGQDAADGDTEGQGYHSLPFSRCSMGEAGLKKDHRPGKHTELMPAACGRTWAWVNHQWFRMELNLAASGFHFEKEENWSSQWNPSSKSLVKHKVPSICLIPAPKPCPLPSSLPLANFLPLFPTYQGPHIFYLKIFFDSPVSYYLQEISLD